MRHRKLLTCLAVVCAMAGVGASPATEPGNPNRAGAAPCDARPNRVNDVAFQWYTAPKEDRPIIEQWCRAVGDPLVAATPEDAPAVAPALEDLVVVSWNAHLSEGRLVDLISDLRSGALTGGEPVDHFVLLVQELYRRGDEVPAFVPGSARSAYAIKAAEPDAPDVEQYAHELGLAMAYVPSMRNGAELFEDRGNAIVSTEPLADLFAFELPFERQRRVAAGAAILVQTDKGLEPLQVVDTHLEPLASPSSLWVFRNPRRRQMAALLDLMREPRFENGGIGTIIGGDFNTVQGGAREEIYRYARTWSRSLTDEDPRATHLLGRLDYVFARLSPGWGVETRRVDDKYGSDHHPVLARFRR